MVNIQSALRTAPDFCKNVSLAYYLVATVVHIQFLRSYIRIYISSQYTDAGRAKEIKKNWDSSECRVSFGGTRIIGSSAM